MWIALTLITASTSTPQGLEDFQEITSSQRGAMSVCTGDVDGDGRIDVVSASAQRRDILYFPGRPGGVSDKALVVASQTGLVHALEVADLDADGNMDVLAIAGSRQDVLWLRGDGAGGFERVRLAENQVLLGSAIYALDYDEDGDLDVIAMHRIETFGDLSPVLIENMGAANFANPSQLVPASQSYTHLAQMDVDRDGRLDLVLSGGGQRIDWFRQPAVPGNSWARTTILELPFSRMWDLSTGDLDGDGDLDLAMGDRSIAEFHFIENLGPNSFGQRVELNAGSTYYPELELVDADLDGDLDALVASPINGAARWIENLGGFVFEDRGGLLGAPFLSVTTLHADDIDGDGRVDVALGAEGGPVHWLRGAAPSGGGLAFEATSRRLDQTIPLLLDSRAVDLDGDGLPEILSVSASQGLLVTPGEGARRFGRATEIQSPGINSLEVVDLDGGGREDALMGTWLGQVFWAPGTGTTIGPSRLLDGPGPQLTASPMSADFDGDGDLDVVMVHFPSLDIEVIEQTTPSAFLPARSLTQTPDPITELKFRDVNADGIGDFVLATRRTAAYTVGWIQGLGAGQFAPFVPISADISVDNRLVYDVNGSGLPDIVWFRQAARLLMRSRNQGGGVFAPPQVLGQLSARPEAMAPGPPGPNGQATAVLALRNNLTAIGSFAWVDVSGSTLPLLAELRNGLGPVLSISTADVSGDGDLDVLVNGYDSGQLGWLENSTLTDVGSAYCAPAVPNSTGVPATLRIRGSAGAMDNEATLDAFDLPPGATTLFLTSQTDDFVTGPGGSAGNLCLGGTIGRFAGPGQIAAATGPGFASLGLDLSALPQPNGAVSAMAGETWRFQAWYRDQQMGVATSNFTGAALVLLR